MGISLGLLIWLTPDLLFMSLGREAIPFSGNLGFAATTEQKEVQNRFEIVYPKENESSRDYLLRLLPYKSENRLRLLNYLERHGITEAPRSLVWKNKAKTNLLLMNWSLVKDAAAQVFQDSLEIVSLEAGQFRINGQSVELSLLENIYDQLSRVESFLGPSNEHLHPSVLRARHQRQNPWPREKGGVFLLGLMYSLYFSLSSHRCLAAEIALGKVLLDLPKEIVDIPKCEDNGVELVLQADENRGSSHMRWLKRDPERITIEERSESGELNRETTYEFDNMGLQLVSIKWPWGKKSIFGTKLSSKNLISRSMLKNFRESYGVLEKLRNAGREWGFTCSQGCHQELVSSLVVQPKNSLASKRVITRTPSSDKINSNSSSILDQ